MLSGESDLMEKLFERLKLWHIVALAAVVYLLALNGRISTWDDDSRYILMSKALLENGVFQQLVSFEASAAYGAFFFVLPLLLVPIVSISPYLFLAMKLIPLSAGIFFVIALYQFLDGIVPSKMRKIIVLLCAINPWIAGYSVRILTEIPYLAFSTITLLLMKRYTAHASGRLLYSGFLMAMVSFYTRPAGIALISAIIMFLALSKRWKHCLAISVLTLIVLMPLTSDFNRLIGGPYSEAVSKKDHYLSDYHTVKARDMLGRIGYNFLAYTGNYLPDLLARPIVISINPRLPTKRINPVFPAKFAFGIFLAGMIFAGFAASATSGLKVHHLYAAIYFLLLLPLNVYVARYLIPLVPFAILWFFTGIEYIAGVLKVRRLRFWRGNYPYVPFFIFFLMASAVGTAQEIAVSRTGRIPAEEKSFLECTEWIKGHIPADAVVLSRKPYHTRLMTGRNTVGYFLADDPARQLEYIMKNKARYVIIGDLGSYLNEASYLMDTVKRYPENFRLLYSAEDKPKNYVYEAVY
jgi:hypothetical protein